jgi:hypothetical protein
LVALIVRLLRPSDANEVASIGMISNVKGARFKVRFSTRSPLSHVSWKGIEHQNKILHKKQGKINKIMSYILGVHSWFFVIVIARLMNGWAHAKNFAWTRNLIKIVFDLSFYKTFNQILIFIHWKDRWLKEAV